MQRRLRRMIFSSGWFLIKRAAPCCIGKYSCTFPGVVAMLRPSRNARESSPSSNVNPAVCLQRYSICAFETCVDPSWFLAERTALAAILNSYNNLSFKPSPSAMWKNFLCFLNIKERSQRTDTRCATVLDLMQIRQAVIHRRSGMLIRLLQQMWTSPKTAVLSAANLTQIMNEPIANQYPDFQNMTRVLAMEVAAKWKTAEIERTGRKVHRGPMDWPLRLIYPTIGSSYSETWYIP